MLAITAPTQRKTLFDTVPAVSAPAAEIIGERGHNPMKNMSLPAASMIILSKKNGLTNQELARMLESAGFVHGGSNFANLVGTALWRVRNAGNTRLRRDGRKWFLDPEAR